MVGWWVRVRCEEAVNSSVREEDEEIKKAAESTRSRE